LQNNIGGVFLHKPGKTFPVFRSINGFAGQGSGLMSNPSMLLCQVSNG